MHESKLRLPQEAARKGQRKRAVWLGFAGSVLARVFRGRSAPVTPRDLKKHDYPTSTQRLGIRFTARIRDTFRFRWLRRMG